MAELEIKTLEDSIHTIKENQTIVDYFLFDEYEIHFNQIPPHSVQEWHYHSKIEETLFIIEGTISVYWEEGNETRKQLVEKNSVIRVKQSIHTFANETNKTVQFIVFRFVPDGSSKSELIKKDKTVVVKEK